MSALVVLTGAALCCGLRRGRDEQQLIVRDGGGFRRWEQPSSLKAVCANGQSPRIVRRFHLYKIRPYLCNLLSGRSVVASHRGVDADRQTVLFWVYPIRVLKRH